MLGVLEPEAVAKLEVVELFADDAREGGAHHSSQHRLLRQSPREQVHVIKVTAITVLKMVVVLVIMMLVSVVLVVMLVITITSMK